MRTWKESAALFIVLCLASLVVAYRIGYDRGVADTTPETTACHRADGGFLCDDGTWSPDPERRPDMARRVADEVDPPEITEDMPGWDCATMGNRLCGPPE